MIYEFFCKKCLKKFELQLKVADRNKGKCDCGEKAERLISKCGFVLKGDGWARDNYGITSSKEQNEG